MSAEMPPAGPPPLRPFGLVLHHDGRFSHEGEPIRNRRLREHFERNVEYLADEKKYIVRLQHFRGEVVIEEAGFFDTRGGYERVVEGVDQLISLYGEDQVEDLAAQRALRDKAGERLMAFDRTTYKAQRERLQLLADAFAAASEPELEKLVKDYIQKHLPEADEGAAEGGRD